jgi:hypothetical protein
MKNGVYNILKARFLIDDDAVKNWRFIVFSFHDQSNTQRFEQKYLQLLI